MKREPLDLEGRVWLAEAKRELGRPAEALAELSRPELATPDGLSPMLVWGLVNRALAKAALGDAEGLRADFALIPADMLDFVMARSRTKSPEAVLKAALRLARGFRREEYGQAVWMRRA
ncbi:MAG: hypothetical protein M0D55_13480 [Elusimicrobiota bacterium]|nr:MAG: hypothetical protein M0D55_13480 [Elusimicrobiota bacterium]